MKKARHKVLYEQLLKSIEENVYAADSFLPSENDLCKAYSITRPTVRQALLRLENEGYIKKQHGKGSVVLPLKKGIGILSLDGTTSTINSSDLKTKIVTKPEIISWPKNLPFRIEYQEDKTSCIFMERVRILKSQPILFETTYIPNVDLPNFIHLKFKNKSLFDTLVREYNIKITGGTQKIWSIQAPADIHKVLHLKQDKPLIKLQRKLDTNRTNFHIYTIVYCNTDSYYLQSDF